MNELFIQETYTSNDVEHVKIRSITSGELVEFEKHKWGTKISRHEHLYGHVQVKTLLGHVAFEHRGAATNKNFTNSIRFSKALNFNKQNGPRRHLCYNHETQTLWIQDYRIEETMIAASPIRFVPFVKMYKVLPPGVTATLGKYDIDNYQTEEEMICLNSNFTLQYRHMWVDRRQLQLVNISGPLIEAGTLDKTYIVPMYDEHCTRLTSSLLVDYNPPAMAICIMGLNDDNQKIQMIIDPDPRTLQMDFVFDDGKTSVHAATFDELKEGVTLYNDIREKRIEMIIFRHVEEVRIP